MSETKSIITKWMQYCMVCGKPREHVHHALYNTGKRKLADSDKLLMPLCQYHHEDSKNGVHNNMGMKTLSQALAEACWERQWIAEHCENPEEILEQAREAFKQRYSEFYL